MEKAVSGHGTFIYDAAATIARYGSVELVAAALKECDIQHAWVRIHGGTQTHPAYPTLPLINALKGAGIAVAGWGWCPGDHISLEVERALTALSEFNLEHYVADVEDGVAGANWSVSEIKTFFKSLRAALPSSQIGVSTFGFIPWHTPKLMSAAEPFVDFFAPQVYWFTYPTLKILQSVGASTSQYPLDSPVSFARLCIDQWRNLVKKPLVMTGQAYWGEIADYTQGKAEAKLQEFITNFDQWKKLQGLNWWHMGGKGQNAMSFAMYQAIKTAQLNGKFSE
jgi:hypothetical protein